MELVRYLLDHPGFELAAITSSSKKGHALAELCPSLLGKTDLTFTDPPELDTLVAAGGLDAVFLAVPPTASMPLVPSLLHSAVVIDLSADFRLKDPDVYQKWYLEEHCVPSLLAEAVYGQPELKRTQLYAAAQRHNEVQAPVLVACAGCYPTASALAIAPSLAAGVAQEQQVLVINAISGVSGAGKKVTESSLFCELNESLNAYGVATHRHTPEIEQVLSEEAGYSVRVQFTPHLAPLTRGLVSTATISLKPGQNAALLYEIYQTAYADEPFVQLLPLGQMPKSASVRGSNQAQVGIAFDERTNMLVASCAIDNLGKGAASQAIQCANIIFGYPETAGLTVLPPVV